MPERLDDVQIDIEVITEKAKAEVEKFERTIEQTEEKADRKRAGREKVRARKAETSLIKESKKAAKTALKTLSGIRATYQILTTSGRPSDLITRALDKIPLPLPPSAKRLIGKTGQVLETLTELGVPIVQGVAGEVAEKLNLPEGTAPMVEKLAKQVGVLSSGVTEIKTAMSAIAPTIQEVSAVGLALSKTPLGGQINPEFVVNFATNAYDYNRAQGRAKRFAMREGLKNQGATITKLALRMYEQ